MQGYNIITLSLLSVEPAAAEAEGGANSPVATTTAVSAKESTTASSVKPKRTRGKSTGAKPRGKVFHVVLKIMPYGNNIIEAKK